MATPGQEIIIKDDRIGVNIFGGYIKDVSTKFLTPSETVETYGCQDYTKLITDVASGVTADYSAGASTEKAILTALFAAYCPTVAVGAHVITGALAAINFSDSSLQRAIDELAAINDRKWFVDYDKELHYFTAGDELASFGLSDSPNESTTFGYAALEHTIDEESLERVTLITWQPGLFSGQTVGITNATLSWTAKTFLITNVITSLKSARNNVAPYALEYKITLGTIPKQRFTNEVIRSGRVITTARIADLAVTDAKIENLTASKITAGNITVAATIGAGGILQTAATGARVTIAPSGIKLYDATTQRGLISNDGSGWFGSSSDFRWTSAGVLSINGAKIDNASIVDAAISTCSVGKLTAGSLTVAATLGTGGAIQSAASGTRITITPSEIAGYNGATKQFYLQASDGKAYCGGGAIVLDSTGILLASGTSVLRLKNAAADASYGFMNMPGASIMQIGCAQIQITNDDFTWAADGEDSIRIGVTPTNYIKITAAYVGLSVYGLKASALIEAQDGINVAKSSAPGGPSNGCIYYNTTDNKLYVFKSASWHEVITG
jgi:hypothetical protein